MKKKILQIIETKQEQQGFIKVTDLPVTQLSIEQKALLNRKGNILFNDGDIEGARRIFVSTGYSDGLTRVGDYWMTNKNQINALKFYLLAHNQRKSEPLIEKIARIISTLIKES